MPLEVTILGSGVIIPTIRRRATSLLIRSDDFTFLMDCGPSTPEALEENGLAYHSVETVMFTHYHPDHTLGVGHLFSALKNDRRVDENHHLRFYGPPGLIRMVEGWRALYPTSIPAGNRLELNEIGEGLAVDEKGVRISASSARHGDRGALSYRVDSGEGSFVYTGDTGYTEDLVEISGGSDLLISECSFPEEMKMDSHLTPAGVGRLAERAGVNRVILVHMYPEFGDTDPAAEVGKYYRGPVKRGYDGMRVKLV